ncbi:Trimeric GatFAB AmidoTransferase(AdT) complex subunit, partial [Entophlyctis luteolus]
YVSPFNATVVTLLSEAGASIRPEKGNMDEFGMGSYNVHSIHGPVRNPRDSSRVSGGSSGGSAAAVAAGLCRAALGTDTGGSIRLPASYCGVVGFKPSYGRFSRWGVVSYASSLDTVGVLANTVADCESIYRVLNYRDSKDPTSLEFLNDSRPKQELPLNQIKIGIPRHVPHLLSPSILQLYSETITRLESLGAEIVPINLVHHEHALGAYYTIACAEASSNLARFDGMRFGALGPHASDAGGNLKSVRNMFGETVKRRVMLGSFVLGSSEYATYFSQSQKIRRLIQQSYNTAFVMTHPFSPSGAGGGADSEKVDFILTPASATTARTFEHVEKGEIVDEFMDDAMTVPVSLAGLPAVVVPCGKWDTGSMESAGGMQLIGQFGDDERVLQAAKALETHSIVDTPTPTVALVAAKAAAAGPARAPHEVDIGEGADRAAGSRAPYIPFFILMRQFRRRILNPRLGDFRSGCQEI